MLALVLLLAAAEPPHPGEVKLPLRDYLALVERAEAADRARAQAATVEPPVAELVSQRSALAFEDGRVEVTTRFEAEVRGTPVPVLTLPVTGMVWKTAVEGGPATLHGGASGITLVPRQPGHFVVSVSSRIPLQGAPGEARVTLAPIQAPVNEAELVLPAGDQWRVEGALVVDDATRDGRRVVRVSLPRGKPVVVETRRPVQGGEAEKVLANAVVVTILQISREGAQRQDVVLYEVSRGRLSELRVTPPRGLDVQRVGTDLGEAPLVVEDGALVVARPVPLTGTGYLVLTSRASTEARIPLALVVPTARVRARYLAVASSVAATLDPEPKASWTRVDLTDLPEEVREAAPALQLSAAWQLAEPAAETALVVGTRPSAAMAEPPILRRETTTLVTVEGTVLTRDRFTVGATANAVGVGLAPGATLWSAQVDGVAVRPLGRPEALRVPLGVRGAGDATVEVVSVHQGAIPEGRSRITLVVPSVTARVLEHRWRVLLPANHRYRLAAATLRPTAEPPAGGVPGGILGGVVGGLPASASRTGSRSARGTGGTCGVRGNALDESAAPIPGATITLSGGREAVSATTGADGSFWISDLPPGRYKVACSLGGFQTDTRQVEMVPGMTSVLTCRMRVASVQETVTVTADMAVMDSRAAAGLEDRDEARRKQAERKAEADARARKAADAYAASADDLKQGLVGGVKPVPVVIPEAGKLLFLAGALPPERVEVELDVKNAK